MSSEKVTDASFIDRFLRLISEKAKGKPTVFAKKAGISHGSVFNYIKGRMPDAENLRRIRDSFGVNINWLLTGQGDMYLQDAGGQVAEPQHPYNLPEEMIDAGIQNPGGEPEGENLRDLLGLAQKVLSSGNKQAADALEKNIRYFAHAIEVETRLERLEDRLEALEDILREKKEGKGKPGNHGKSSEAGAI